MTYSASCETPLVAIVTPVYNGAEFLAETLDAVQAQTYPNLVHVVHDNASTDATPDILARYRNARVSVMVARNQRMIPMGQNWNAAVSRVPAEARYFRVLCADDLIHPEFVARMVELMERRPSVIVAGCGLRHRSEDAADTLWERDREVFRGREAVQRFFLGTGLIIAHQTIFRRSVLNLRNPFFDAELAANDTDTCLDLLREGDWGFVHNVLAVTRDHPKTHTREVVRFRIDQCDHLVLLQRHAEYAFGQKEGRRLTQTYRRYYFRQLLRWRMDGMRDVYERHLKVLRPSATHSIALQFLDAVADWPLVRLGIRPTWKGTFDAIP